MIVPNTWLLNLQTNRIRQYIFNQITIDEIVHYNLRVFYDATVDTEVTIFCRKPPELDHKVKISVVKKNGQIDRYAIPQADWQKGNGTPVNIYQKPNMKLIADRLRNLPLLDEVCLITQGTKPFQVGKGKPLQTREIVEQKPYVADIRKDETFRPLLRGSLMNRYTIIWDNNYYISLGDWLAEPRYSANYDVPSKIVIRQTGDDLVATLDRHQFVVRDNLYTIVPRQNGTDLRYILGLLNSVFFRWYYQNILNPEKGEALAQVKRGHLAQLPIRTINFEDAADKARHDRMVKLVESMLDLHRQLGEAGGEAVRQTIEAVIASTDREIDDLVYKLYGLTEEEIKIVEGG